MSATMAAAMELKSMSKHFGGIVAVRNVSMAIDYGEVTCLLGDNGAGKSTLIKVMSGVHRPSAGELRMDGAKVEFVSPRAARARGVATVHQDVGTFPLMDVGRNFFVGREPERGRGLFRRIDRKRAGEIAVEQMQALGIRHVTSGDQVVGTLSGGERQALAIARALYFGARLLIMDEPTSALGVKEAGIVLRLTAQVKAKGVAIVFVTHNADHALAVGDQFVVLAHGAIAARFASGERSREVVTSLMAGGEELHAVEAIVGGAASGVAELRLPDLPT
jgi:simple sugar transport system ATP-binding protein